MSSSLQSTNVVSVFTTNCPLDRLDPGFKRPGRIDVILRFPPPSPDLRRALIGRWHPDILAAIPAERLVASTNGLSFAELDEMRNLLVMRFTDIGTWEWEWAQRQFAANRDPLTSRATRPIGFAVEGSFNGHGGQLVSRSPSARG